MANMAIFWAKSGQNGYWFFHKFWLKKLLSYSHLKISTLDQFTQFAIYMRQTGTKLKFSNRYNSGHFLSQKLWKNQQTYRIASRFPKCKKIFFKTWWFFSKILFFIGWVNFCLLCFYFWFQFIYLYKALRLSVRHIFFN